MDVYILRKDGQLYRAQDYRFLRYLKTCPLYPHLENSSVFRCRFGEEVVLGIDPFSERGCFEYDVRYEVLNPHLMTSEEIAQRENLLRAM